MFVAAWPDESTLKRLTSRCLGPAAGVSVVGAGHWHVTLRFLGEVDDDLVPGLADAIREVARSVPGPVLCELGPATGWFIGERVLQIPATGLDELAGAVRSATAPL